jgi:threonine synthase
MGAATDIGAARLACVWCETERGLDLDGACRRCGGTLEVRGGGVPEISPSPSSVWDYQVALPVPRHVSLGEGGTPLLELGRLYGGDRVFAKAEFANPTGSFKDRGSAVALSAVVELEGRAVVCASTGNNAASVSAYAARAGIRAVVIVPASTPPAKTFQARVHGATIVEVDGNFSDAHRLAAGFAEIDPAFANLTSTFVSPYMTAAHATLLYELVGQLGEMPGSVVIPVGAGPMLVGIMAGAHRLVDAGVATCTVVPVGVQGAGCAPIAEAFAAGTDAVEAWRRPVTGSAGSINDPLIGYPDDGTRTLRSVREAGGQVVAVSDGEIAEAMTDLGAIEGIGCEPAAASTLAALRLLEARAALPRPVVLVLSGHALKDPSADIRAKPTLRVEANVDPHDLARRVLADESQEVEV